MGNAHGLQALRDFFKSGLQDFDTTAALFPSSRFLVRAMLDPIDWRHTQTVVELGVGTGALTGAILRRLGPRGRLYAVELNGDLLAHACRDHRDPRIVPVHGDAAHINALLRARGGPSKVDAVISSLGLSILENSLRERIMGEVMRALKPDGAFAQYSYVHARYVVYSQERRELYRFNARKFLQRYFIQLRTRLVVRNLPPALVFVGRGHRMGVPLADVRELPVVEARRRAFGG